MLHKLDEPSLADVRTLKTAAKKKTRAANIARSLKTNRGRYSAKGIQPGAVSRFSGLVQASDQEGRLRATLSL